MTLIIACCTDSLQTGRMKMPKATDEMKQDFRDLIEPLTLENPEVVVKPMFGQLGAFVNGNMFAGLFAPTVGVKLSADEAEALVALGGGPFGPAERPMGGYLTLPDSLTADERAAWVARAAAYVGTFPPKVKK
jgi:TfoX/Sxy family transcriptional regulator of competence genes